MEISVVMASFNNPVGLRQTVESIMLQEIIDYELVIIDDGSSNVETLAYLNDLKKRFAGKIRIVYKDVNEGLTKALIDGCSVAKGRYIARIDSGDIMVPKNRLSLQYQFLEKNPEYVIVGGSCDIYDYVNMMIFRINAIEDEERILRECRTMPVFVHVSVMFLKKAYMEAGGYNESVYYGQDRDLWPRILMHGKGYNFPDVFVRAPMYKNSLSVGTNNGQQIAKLKNNFTNIKNREAVVKSLKNIASSIIQLFLPKNVRLKMRYNKHAKLIGKINETTSLADM